VVSVWGNDFTLHAPSTRAMTRFTRLAMGRADALHTDCRRDVRLARQWGFPVGQPNVVLPGGGGIQMAMFAPPATLPTRPTLINPRGLRAYVCNETFFQALSLVLKEVPELRVLCPAMAGDAQAQRWVADLGLQGVVELLPFQSRGAMADLFRRSQVVVSPTTHDGTPNTLLEAIACGCYPVVGDLESLREWFEEGVNASLVDPRDAAALAQAILAALRSPDLRRQAAKYNRNMIAQRADYNVVMAQAEVFYRSLLGPFLLHTMDIDQAQIYSQQFLAFFLIPEKRLALHFFYLAY